MTSSSGRGIGVEGAIGPAAAAELAVQAEALGYQSFWINVLGAKVEPYETLALCARRTRNIEIGVGLFPLDKFPAVEIASGLRNADIDTPRVILGIAGGQMKQGVLQATEDAVGLLRGAFPKCRIATGGYGPKMLELGGRRADAILGNWLVPDRLQWLIDSVKVGSDQAQRALPTIYLYHRAAVGADAVSRLKQELQEYRRYPVHLKHQESMGNPQWIGVAASDRSEVRDQLAPYMGRCKVVLKPLAHDANDISELQSLLRFFAP